MKKNVKISLTHILDSINLIEEYIKDKSKSDFLKSKQLQDSVIRNYTTFQYVFKYILLYSIIENVRYYRK